MGEASEMSGEAASRTDINFRKVKKIIRGIGKTGKPVVLVLFSGRPWLSNRRNAKCPDIFLMFGFPGLKPEMQLQMFYLVNYNPSGKLTATWPQKCWTDTYLLQS